MTKRLTSPVTSLPPPGELARLRGVIDDQQNMIDELADGSVEALAQSLPESVGRLLVDLLGLERSRANLQATCDKHIEDTAHYRAAIAGLERDLGEARGEIERLTEALAEALKQHIVPYRPSSVGEGKPALSRTAPGKRRPRAA